MNIDDMVDLRGDLMDAIGSIYKALEALRPWKDERCDVLDDIRRELEQERDELESQINSFDRYEL